ncbi:hypothetical protein AMTRI_Chr13g92180 [Amborella trichopoda]
MQRPPHLFPWKFKNRGGFPVPCHLEREKENQLEAGRERDFRGSFCDPPVLVKQDPITSPFHQMDHHCLVLCLHCVILSLPCLLAQQPYHGEVSPNNSSSNNGYTCIDAEPSFEAISELYGSDPNELARINSVSLSAIFQDGKEVIIPVNCHCSDMYYKVEPKKLSNGSQIKVPLKCACPSNNYPVIQGDSISSVSLKFSVIHESILDANELSKENSDIYPLTTLLIPLEDEPFFNGIISPPPTLSPPSTTQISRIGRYVGLGVGVGIPLLILCCVFLHFFCFYNRKKRSGQAIDEENPSKPESSKRKKLTEFLDDLGTNNGLKVYRYRDFHAATNGFSSEFRIKGSVYFGNVNGTVLAIKKVNTYDLKETIKTEKINHLNVVRLLGLCFNQDSYYLVYESKTLKWMKRVQIALDVANGLQYFHNHARIPYPHGNVNSSSILLDTNFRAKITDCRLAGSKKARNAIDGRGYMAPEHLQNGLVTPLMDVYAFGVVLLELITGRESIVQHQEGEVLLSEVIIQLIEHDNAKEELKGWMEPVMDGNYPLDLAFAMVQLIGACLRQEPERRPSMNGVFQCLSKIYVASWLLCNNSSGSMRYQ